MSRVPTADDPADAARPAGARWRRWCATSERSVASDHSVDGRLLFGLWGVVWLLGFGALWLAESVAGFALVAGWGVPVFAPPDRRASSLTAVHIGRRGRRAVPARRRRSGRCSAGPGVCPSWRSRALNFAVGMPGPVTT